MPPQTAYTFEGLAIVSDYTLNSVVAEYRERSKRQVLRRHTDDVLKRINGRDQNFFAFAAKQPRFLEGEIWVPVQQIGVAGLCELLIREDEQALPLVSQCSIGSFERDIDRSDHERRLGDFYSGMVDRLKKNPSIFLFFTTFFKEITRKYLAEDRDFAEVRIMAAQNYELLRRQADSNRLERQVFDAEGKKA